MKIFQIMVVLASVSVAHAERPPLARMLARVMGGFGERFGIRAVNF